MRSRICPSGFPETSGEDLHSTVCSRALPLRAMRTLSEGVFTSRPALAFSLALGFGFLLSAMSCPVVSKAVLFFSPLLASTGACLAVVYLFFLSQGGAEEAELLLINVGGLEHAVQVRVSGDSKLGLCGDRVRVDSRATQAPVKIGRVGCASDATVGSSLATDDLAEGLWNGFFGSYSRWHYGEEDLQE
ncbi:unnamed protein product [Spirodela intermedia]|uniref:Uncharacterized protein n=1 Tax=Spirodela intermedia TaxID=51605 RepID=A0A7I8IA98_SPIIN|nr:unnamed protein product [Spirodela intermedia]CAA6653821.1 unnamed protein product [Spirodela intermedia]